MYTFNQQISRNNCFFYRQNPPNRSVIAYLLKSKEWISKFSSNDQSIQIRPIAKMEVRCGVLSSSIIFLIAKVMVKVQTF
jgi:hypothetical protein